MLNMDSLGFLMAQVVKANHGRMQTLLGEIGLYPGQPPILFMLWEKDGRMQSEFSEVLDLKPATVTVMLKRMEKKGLISRKQDNEDLRVTRVFLTEKGNQLQGKVERVTERLNEECFEGFTEEEKILLRRFFIQMRDNLIRQSS